MGFWVSLLGVLILTLHNYIPAVEDNIQTFSFNLKFYIWSRWNWQIVVSHARTKLQNTLLHYSPVQIVCQCGVFAGT